MLISLLILTLDDDGGDWRGGLGNRSRGGDRGWARGGKTGATGGTTDVGASAGGVGVGAGIGGGKKGDIEDGCKRKTSAKLATV